jgi:Lrp/AsnC family leucine-responsive transcriptional regulator
MIDEIDTHILSHLQGNARISNAELARCVGLAPSAVLERVRKLESRGIVAGYEGRVDPHVLGLSLLAFVFVRADEPVGEPCAGEALATLPNVLEVHHIAGEDCYLIKVRARDTESLGRMLREDIGAIPVVRSTKTTIVLGTLKESSQLPLPQCPALPEVAHA